MTKQIQFSKTGNYNGRNGYAQMKGIEVMTGTKDGHHVMLAPINSKAVAQSTWMEIHIDDIPALIETLRESIKA